MTTHKPHERTVAGFFSGTGGVELGFQQAGFKIAFSNEWDKNASITHRANFGTEHFIEGDINTIDLSSIPETTVLTGGFPCQAFSIAGYRKGFSDDKGRGNLFFKLAEIIDEKKPQVVFLENVKNLVHHDEGKTFKIILETLETLGYFVKWQVLNAKDYGNIPQGRERIYIVAFRNKQAYETFSFPKPIPLMVKVRHLVDLKTKLDDKYYYTKEKNPTMFQTLDEGMGKMDGSVYQWRRKYVRENKSGVCPTLVANMGLGGHNVPLIRTENGIRKLTPRECFNLQGYPEDFILPNIAHGQLYKQAGNAVVVPVVKRIAEKIMEALNSIDDEF